MKVESTKHRFLFLACSSIKTNASVLRAFLAHYLVINGHEVHLLLEDDPANRNWVGRNLPTVHAHYQSRYENVKDLPYYLAERIRLINEIQPDIVHFLAIGWKNFLTIILLTFYQNKNLICIADFDELYSAKYSSFLHRKMYSLIENKSVQNSHKIICASKFLLNHFSRNHQNFKQFLYLPYAYNPNIFDVCQDQAKKIKQEYSPRNILLYMGTLCKEYQSDQVLELANRMQYARNKVVFLLIGGGTEIETTKKWVLKRSLQDFVYVLGYLPDEMLLIYLLAADVFLFPIKDNITNQARCPNKTFQYIGANRPIVTNRVGEVEQALGNYGYYYDFNDLESFENAVLSALSDSESYDASSLFSLHTWEKRCLDYLEWLS